MDRELLISRINEHLLPLLDERDVELIDTTYTFKGGKTLLRVLIDEKNPESKIALTKLAKLNREISNLLDETDIIETSFILEVSSPGLDRPLKTKKDFQRTLGQELQITILGPDNKKITYYGQLKVVNKDKITIRTEEDKLLDLSLEEIVRAKRRIVI